MTARRFLAVGAVALFVSRIASAERVLLEQVRGHAVQVDRGADGALAVRIDQGAPARLAASGTVVSERVELAGGTVLVVRVNGDAPAGAVIAAEPGQAPRVLFSGTLAWVGEDVGHRVRTEIVTRDVDGDGHNDVVLAVQREDVALCGGIHPWVDSGAVHPERLSLVRVTVNPVHPNVLAAGSLGMVRAVHGVVRATTPAGGGMVARIVAQSAVVRGAASASGAAVTDGELATAWVAARHGFVSVDVNAAGHRVEWVRLAAPSARGQRLPRRVMLLLGGEQGALEVDLPTAPPGGWVDIPVVPARAASCMSVVVLDGDGNGDSAIAEVNVASDLDAAADPAEALITDLDGAAALQAAELLAGLGERGAAAVVRHAATISERAARAVIATFGSLRSARGASVLVALADRDDVADELRAAIARMGAVALPALGEAVATHPRVADVIAVMIAPLDVKLGAMVGVLGAERRAWHTARGAVRTLVRSAAESGSLERWLDALPDDPGAAARGLTLAMEVAASDAQRAAIAARARRVSRDRFEDHYRLLLPLAGDDEGRALVADTALHAADPNLRCEAARALRGRGADGVLAQLLADRVPRVRAMAARGLAGRAEARDALVRALHSDAWPSVRMEALGVLAGDAANTGEILGALDDESVGVVRVALAAVERVQGAEIAARLMAFAEDTRRNPVLRGDAIDVLAARCERGYAARLEALVRSQSDAMLPLSEQALAHGALAALARIDGARAVALLTELGANAAAQAAVARARRTGCAAERHGAR